MRVNLSGQVIDNDDIWIAEWLDVEFISTRDVENIISNLKDEEELEINLSTVGGSVDTGVIIYGLLKQVRNKVVINIIGRCYSVGTVIMMAGDEINMSSLADIMIHNVSMGSYGDYRDKEKDVEHLKKANTRIKKAYARTGLEDDVLQELLDNETYLTSDEAKELNFIDNIVFKGGE